MVERCFRPFVQASATRLVQMFLGEADLRPETREAIAVPANVNIAVPALRTAVTHGLSFSRCQRNETVTGLLPLRQTVIGCPVLNASSLATTICPVPGSDAAATARTHSS